ncbi:MAG TPA: NADP-dependent oxidoreductase [Candidatus Dormibacteraeota bacterium]|nr:NADP-dependent oxidoreductase [Candidatus Dormibacteraeota bacterium]
MKAAQIKQYGGPKVLKTVKNVPKPKIREGFVLVEVYAAAVNPFDWKVRSGLAQSMAQLDFPAILGGDFSGIVTEIGEAVSSVKLGDAVFGQANALGGQGSFADYTLVKAESLASKPQSVDFLTAAALPLTAVSAYQALVENGKLKSGQKILIHGGSGGIGSIAIQLAKHLGAFVATTTDSTGIEYVRNLGADKLIDYKNQDFTKLVKNYDMVYDTVGGQSYQKSYQTLRPGGLIVSMVEQPNQQLMDQYKVTAINQFTQVNTRRLNKVAKLVENAVLRVHIDKVFSLEQAGIALGYLQTGHPHGKVVLKVKNPQAGSYHITAKKTAIG